MSRVHNRQAYVAQMQQRIEVDTTRINAMLARLNDKDAKKAIKSALKKSASIIRKDAQSRWVSAVPDGEYMKNDINIAVFRNASGARVDLIDKRRKGSKQFVLKFFNSGTKERVTLGKKSKERTSKRKPVKAGTRRGAITATNFFDNAVSAQTGNAEKSLEDNIIKEIIKRANKK